VNAAAEILATGASAAEAAAEIARAERLSDRQARRYAERARDGGQVSRPHPKATFSVRVDAALLSSVREFAKAHQLGTSDVVSLALSEFLAADRPGLVGPSAPDENERNGARIWRPAGDPTPPTLVINVLGALEIYRNGVPIELRGPRERVLVGLLVVRGNAGINCELLGTELWGDRHATGASTLRSYVCRLRAALKIGDEAQILATGEKTYMLPPGTYSCDAHEFVAMIDLARNIESPDQRSELFQQALALWRGRAFGDVSATRLLSAESHQLEELMLSALEERIESDLARGLHRQLVPELQSLVVLHPLRERLSRSLALALYRSGRSAEALRHIHEYGVQLRERAGVDPSGRFSALEHAMLVREPNLDWRPPVEHRSQRLPPTGVPLAGS
jgi:DNA-binding SARP family transcriptional activator